MIEIFSKLEGLNMELFEKGILPRLVDIINKFYSMKVWKVYTLE
jgi:hypothetical protein